MNANRFASFRSVARAGVIAAGIAAFQLAITSIPGAAATTLGSPAGNLPCSAGMDTVQLSTTGAPSYAVPTGGGVITSWSTQVGATTGQAALLVWRPTTTANTLNLVGESPHVALTANTLNTFTLATPIAVQAGDLLGLRVESTSFCIQSPGTVTGVIGFKAGTTPAVGQPEAFTVDPLNLTLDVSATLGTSAPTPSPSPSPSPTPGSKPGCHDRSHHESEHSKQAEHKTTACGHTGKSHDADAGKPDRDK
jgi:hypothetical protein